MGAATARACDRAVRAPVRVLERLREGAPADGVLLRPVHGDDPACGWHELRTDPKHEPVEQDAASAQLERNAVLSFPLVARGAARRAWYSRGAAVECLAGFVRGRGRGGGWRGRCGEHSGDV